MIRTSVRLCIILFMLVICSCAEAPAQDRVRLTEDSLRHAIKAIVNDGIRLQRDRAPISLDSAVVLFDSAVALTRRYFGTLDSLAVTSLTRCARCLYMQNRLERCDTLLMEAVRAARKLFGPAHRDVGNALRSYGDIERRRGNIESAETLYVQAIASFEESGDTTRSTRSIYAASVAGLGQMYKNIGRYGEAEVRLKETVDLYKSMFGVDDPNLSWSSRVLADILRAQKRYDEAEPLYIDAIRIIDQLPELNRLNKGRLVSAIEGLAATYLYGTTRRYVAADSLYARSEDLWCDLRGGGDPRVAWTISQRGECQLNAGQFGEAQRLFRRSLQIYSERDSLTQYQQSWMAWTTWRLGYSYQQEGRFSEAEAYHLESIQLYENAYDSSHVRVAQVLQSLADVYILQGKIAQAEPVALRSLQIMDRTDLVTSDHHWRFAGAVNTLGRVRYVQGRLDEAIALFEQADEEYRPLLGGAYSASMANIGLIYSQQGLDDKAEEYLLKAIPDRNRKLSVTGAGNASLWASVLAGVYMRQERYDEADSLLQYALDMAQSGYGPDHVRLYVPLTTLGELRFRQGDIEESRRLYARSLELERLSLGGAHVAYSSAACDLGIIEHLLGNDEAATECFAGYDSDRRKFVDALFTFASEKQKLRYAAQYDLIDDVFLSFAVQSQYPAAIKAAALSLIRGKGRVIDAISAERDVAICSDAPELHTALREHARVCADIAELCVANQIAIPGTDRTDLLTSKYRLKDSLETQLSRLCFQFAEALEDSGVTINDIVQSLPQSAVLLDFVKCDAFNFSKTGQKDDFGPAHYLVFVIDSDARVSLHDLGEAAYVDSLIAMFHVAMRAAAQTIYRLGETDAEAELRPVLHDMYDAVFAGIGNRLRARDRMFVCADADLNTIPLELLVDDAGAYLIESMQISYISSGRDMAQPGLVDPSSEGAIILFDPAFDSIPAASNPPGIIAVRGSGQPAETRRPIRRADCLETPVAPLSSTRIEGQTVLTALSTKSTVETTVYSGREATESVLKCFRTPPRIVHLATHGYWCEAGSADSGAAIRDNPLIYSGLLLAGANRTLRGLPPGEGMSDDGVLTALETSALNLRGTELVVLSACQTGLGGVVSGEGVFGLRRAFQHAGARAIVMSMFSVPDDATVTLMKRFYKNWLAGASKSRALREAALSVLRDRREQQGAAHPLFWGGFILAGDPR